MATATREEIISFGDVEEIEEGYPKVNSEAYLARALNATVVVSQSGLPYVEYTPQLVESGNDDPTVDGKDMEIRGFKLPKDRIILFANTLDRDGRLKTPEKLATDTKRMMGTARGVIRRISGEDFTASGTKAEVAQGAADAIRGATFVAVVGLQPERDGFPARNVVREHKSEADWQGR